MKARCQANPAFPHGNNELAR